MLSAFRGPEDELGVSELARALEIPKSSAFQIAATLARHGLLSCDAESRRYRPGPRLLQLALQCGAGQELLWCTPRLRELAATTGRTVLLALFGATEIVLVGKAESPAPLGLSAPLGLRLDHSTGVFGKLLHAHLPAAELEALLEAHPRQLFTDRTLPDGPPYREELARVRRRGWASDVDEYLDGVAAVGAVVRQADGRILGGVALVDLSTRLDEGSIRDAARSVEAAATRLSADLGYRPGASGRRPGEAAT